MRVAPHEFVVERARDVGHREATLLLGDRGMELDLIQQVAELLDQCVVGRRVVLGQILEGVDRLVGLLEEVLDEARVSLFTIPRALLAQGACELVQLDHLSGDGTAERRDVQRGQVVGLDRAIHFRPRRVDHALVGVSKVVQDHDRFVTVGILVGELDVGQHPTCVRLGDEQGTTFVGGLESEAMTIDHAHSFVHRVDAECIPRQVEEAHRGHDDDLHARVCSQECNARLENQW